MNPDKKKLLLTGASGLLGSNLIYFLRDRYDITAISYSRPIQAQGICCHQLDLRNLKAAEDIIRRVDPDVVIHAAAMANVDVCQRHPQEAHDANVVSTINVMAALQDSKARVVYISTDLVYDGSKGNYNEEDSTHPINIYASTKEEAERFVAKHKDALIVRTNFYGFNTIEKRSLAEWGIEQLKSGQNIDGFNDVCFSSIYSGDLADILDQMLIQKLNGIYNLGCQTSMTKYAFLVMLAQLMGLDDNLIRPASVEAKTFPAKRAKDLSLDMGKLMKDLRYPIPTMSQSLERFVNDYRSPQRNSMINAVV